jgi:GLPGLI family protein
MKKKLLIKLLIMNFFSTTIIAQESKFLGKIEYIQETKLQSGEYNSKVNGESYSIFNSDSYSFSNKQGSLDYDKIAEKTVKSLPKEYAMDSFEIAKFKKQQIQKLKQQIKPTNSQTNIDYSNHVSLKSRSVGDDKYCVVDTLLKINWELKEDTMTIDGLVCQKARGFFVSKFYTVWFAPSIPFSAGPLNMHGLPGLIILATSEDEKIRYRMKSINYPLQSPIMQKNCQGEKQVTNAEFMRIQGETRKNMQNQIDERKKELEVQKNN